MRSVRTTGIAAALLAATLGIALWASLAGDRAVRDGAKGPSPTVPSGAPQEATPAVPPAVDLQPVGSDFEQPLYVTAPAGDARRLYVVEKEGRVRVVRDGRLQERPFLDLRARISTNSERGLLSLAFDPDYAVNRSVYVFLTDRPDGTLQVVRYRASTDDRVDPRTGTVLLSIDHPAGNHNGGQLQFGPDGLLYVGVGDGGGAGDPEGDAQNVASRLGKLLTIDTTRPRPAARLYAYGLRNPWRFSFDRGTGDLWLGDVGQSSWEEIDHLPAGTPPGANFGWNAYEGTHPFATRDSGRAGLTWPVFEYDRSLGSSVTGGYVYRGRRIPGLAGWYLFGDFGSGRVWAMKGPHGVPVPLRLGREVPQLASFGEDGAGELYVVSLAGAVYRLVPR